MTPIINSNLTVLEAQDQLNGSQRTTQDSSESMMNAKDCISLLQTADVAMQKATMVLQHMWELLKSIKSTCPAKTDQTIQKELMHLQNELDKIALNTKYKGQPILDGSLSKAHVQIGVNLPIASIKTKSIGSIATQIGSTVAAAASSDITITLGNGATKAINSSAEFIGNRQQNATSAYAKAAAIKNADIVGLLVSALTCGTQRVGKIGGSTGDTYSLTLNGVLVFPESDVSTPLTNTQLRDAINAAHSQTRVTASLHNDEMTLTAIDGSNIDVAERGTGFIEGTDGLTVTDGTFASTLRGRLSISATDTVNIGGAAATLGLTASIPKDSQGIDRIDLSTKASTQTAILRLDSALRTINSNRAVLTELQNDAERQFS